MFTLLLLITAAFLGRAVYLLYAFRMCAPSIPLSFLDACQIVGDEVNAWFARGLR